MAYSPGRSGTFRCPACHAPIVVPTQVEPADNGCTNVLYDFGAFVTHMADRHQVDRERPIKQGRPKLPRQSFNGRLKQSRTYRRHA